MIKSLTVNTSVCDFFVNLHSETKTFWKKSHSFSLFHQITTNKEKRDKRRLPAHSE